MEHERRLAWWSVEILRQFFVSTYDIFCTVGVNVRWTSESWGKSVEGQECGSGKCISYILMYSSVREAHEKADVAFGGASGRTRISLYAERPHKIDSTVCKKSGERCAYRWNALLAAFIIFSATKQVLQLWIVDFIKFFALGIQNWSLNIRTIKRFRPCNVIWCLNFKTHLACIEWDNVLSDPLHILIRLVESTDRFTLERELHVEINFVLERSWYSLGYQFLFFNN